MVCLSESVSSLYDQAVFFLKDLGCVLAPVNPDIITLRFTIQGLENYQFT